MGAITSSTRTLVEERKKILSRLPDIVLSLDPSLRGDFRDLLAAANANPLRSGQELRRARLSAEAKLAALGLPEVEESATLLAQLGLEEVDGKIADIIKANPEALRVISG